MWHIGCPEFSQLFVPFLCASEQYMWQQHCLASCVCWCWLFISCSVLKGFWARLGGRLIWFWFHTPSFNITVTSVILQDMKLSRCYAISYSLLYSACFLWGFLWQIDWSITKPDTLKLYVFWVCSYIFYLSHANMELWKNTGFTIYNLDFLTLGKVVEFSFFFLSPSQDYNLVSLYFPVDR